MRGIRARTTAAATAVVVIVLVAVGVALVLTQRATLTNSVAETLHARSDELATVLSTGMLSDPITGQGDSDAVAQIVAGDGHVVAASANLTAAGASPLPAPSGRSTLRRSHLPTDDATYLVLSRRVETSNGEELTIHTAAPLDDVEESVTALLRSLLVAIPLVAAFLGFLIWFLVGRTLRPVEAIRREVADISGANLDRRVPEPETGDEIADLAHTMNEMLDRVEAASVRQQRFVSDASHELRSPLTRMRAEIEVDLGHPNTADLTATHRSVLDETKHLSRLVDDLLTLARSDDGAVPTRREPVDLDDIVLREGRRISDSGRVAVDLSEVSAAQVSGDRDQLTRAVRNLCENAARHTRTSVMLSVGERDGLATLAVTDDGPGIPEANRSEIFERFTRLDEARRTSDGGSGLGLAIAKDIIDRHNGSIELDHDHIDGARFVVRLPTHAPRSNLPLPRSPHPPS